MGTVGRESFRSLLSRRKNFREGGCSLFGVTAARGRFVLRFHDGSDERNFTVACFMSSFWGFRRAGKIELVEVVECLSDSYLHFFLRRPEP